MTNLNLTPKPAGPRQPYRIVADDKDTGEEREMFRAANLARLVERLEKDGEFLDRLGWECFTIQDWTPGIEWSDLLPEAVQAMVRRGELDPKLAREVRHYIQPGRGGERF